MGRNRRTVDRVMRFVTEANFRHAKFAARLIACMKNANTLCEQVVEASLSGLQCKPNFTDWEHSLSRILWKRYLQRSWLHI